jgi:hypothetical protein
MNKSEKSALWLIALQFRKETNPTAGDRDFRPSTATCPAKHASSPVRSFQLAIPAGIRSCIPSAVGTDKAKVAHELHIDETTVEISKDNIEDGIDGNTCAQCPVNKRQLKP